jgi:DNA repair exonuclease SbcCD ATPase subunit
VWIDRISLENFIVFEAVTVELGPGLNIILSPNEGGKSSLFRGVVTALFVDASSRSREVGSLARWGSSGRFTVELGLRLADGPVRLVRDFRTREQAIYREGEQAPIARGREVDDYLRTHLPIADGDLFLRVCGVRHEELELVSTGGLGERIEELLGGGSAGMTPAGVAKAVEAKRRELVRGIDRPTLDKNAGPVRRLTNEVERAERELARARQSAARREELLKSISHLSSSIERVDREIQILVSKRETANAYDDVERREKEARAKAEELRKRTDRVRSLASAHERLMDQRGRFPEPLLAGVGERTEELAREIELEGILEREAAAARGKGGEGRVMRFGRGLGAGRLGPVWFLAGGALIVGGILGGILWKFAMFSLVALGVGCIVWYLRGARLAHDQSGAERMRELAGLAEKRLAWSGGRGVGEVRELLRDFAKWKQETSDVRARLEELGGGDIDPDGLLRALDAGYGEIALEARGLAERRATLEPFRADADERLRLDRDIRLREVERDERTAERRRREGELAMIEPARTSEIAELLELARENLEEAERRVSVLDLILEALGEARRKVSGRLAERLPPLAAEYLSRVTGGRYAELFVDPLTMQIETVPAAGDAAGTDAACSAGGRVRPESLSQGTRDQIYLAVRLALVELLGHGEPQPLFLDDPFVHFDPTRRERAIELLCDISRRHQVVLFTCDPSYGGRGGHLVNLSR